MNDLFKDSLKDYEESYHPEDWLEMEKRLDNAGLSTGKGNYLKPMVAGAVLIGVLTASWLLFIKEEKQPASNNDGSYLSDQKKITPFNKLTKIKLNKTVQVSEQGIVPIENANNQPVNPIAKPGTKRNELSGADGLNDEPGPSGLGANPMHTAQLEGPMLDMLRRENKNIQEMDAPEASFAANEQSGCIPFKTRFNPNNIDIGTRYLWDFGDGFFSSDANPVHTYVSAGVYTVALTVTSIINEKSNTIRKERMISAHQAPEANFELLKDNTSASGLDITFIDQSIDVIEWIWFFGDFQTSSNKNPSHSYSKVGNYTVTLIGKNSYGCFDTTIGYISVSNTEIANNLYTPTAFSPNGDGVNDEFKPIIAGDENQSYEMTIYDRNGLVVFETKDINKGWDGKIGEGEQAPFGTYIWLVIINGDNKKEQKRLGQVTLLK